MVNLISAALAAVTLDLLVLLVAFGRENETGYGFVGQRPTLQTAVDAYIYGFTLLIANFSVHPSTTNVLRVTRLDKLVNERMVSAPTVDMKYSQSWLRFDEDSFRLFIPDTSGNDGVYYLFPLYDAWQTVVISPSWRTTGKKSLNILIKGPFSKPLEVINENSFDMVADVKTNLAYLIGRTQLTNSSDPIPAMKQANKYTLTKLASSSSSPSSTRAERERGRERGRENDDDAAEESVRKLLKWNNKQQIIDNTSINSSENNTITTTTMITAAKTEGSTSGEHVRNLTAIKFFTILSKLLITNPPIMPQDAEIITRMNEEFGLFPGDASFDFNNLSSTHQQLLEEGARKGMMAIDSYSGDIIETGWRGMNPYIGNYGNQYLIRAWFALYGYDDNLPEDAVYFISVNPYDGKYPWEILFSTSSSGPPPCNAFWSITVYDEIFFLVPNNNNRYSVGSNTDGLIIRKDGSISITFSSFDLNISNTNWLPIAANKKFTTVFRIYWPERDILESKWKPPAIQRYCTTLPFVKDATINETPRNSIKFFPSGYECRFNCKGIDNNVIATCGNGTWFYSNDGCKTIVANTQSQNSIIEIGSEVEINNKNKDNLVMISLIVLFLFIVLISGSIVIYVKYFKSFKKSNEIAQIHIHRSDYSRLTRQFI